MNFNEKRSTSRLFNEEVAEIVARIFNYLNVLSTHPYESEVLRKVMKLDLTIYDASYVILAEKNDLVLLTEDEKLGRKQRGLLVS